MVNSKYLNALKSVCTVFVYWAFVIVELYLVLAIMTCLINVSFEHLNPFEWHVIARGCLVVGSFLIAFVMEAARDD